MLVADFDYELPEHLIARSLLHGATTHVCSWSIAKAVISSILYSRSYLITFGLVICLSSTILESFQHD